VENTAERHNVVVCTLCSCYPWTLLGIPPAWFKYPQYRANPTHCATLVFFRTRPNGPLA